MGGAKGGGGSAGGGTIATMTPAQRDAFDMEMVGFTQREYDDSPEIQAAVKTPSKFDPNQPQQMVNGQYANAEYAAEQQRLRGLKDEAAKAYRARKAKEEADRNKPAATPPKVDDTVDVETITPTIDPVITAPAVSADVTATATRSKAPRTRNKPKRQTIGGAATLGDATSSERLGG